MNENIPKMITRIGVKGKELEEMKSKSIAKNFFSKTLSIWKYKYNRDIYECQSPAGARTQT